MSAPLYQFSEWHHLLFGVEPPLFLVEVALRITILYVVLVVAMRLMGRRMSSQLTRNELLALVSLASAAGPAVQDPMRGLLPPIVCIVVIVLVQRAHARATVYSERIEKLLDDQPCTLVEDGRIMVHALRKNSVSRQRLVAQLRAAGVMQLGMVERVYLEPSGAFTVLPRRTPLPGLSLIPEWDEALVAEQGTRHDICACLECGATTLRARADEPCSRCGRLEWVAATGRDCPAEVSSSG